MDTERAKQILLTHDGLGIKVKRIALDFLLKTNTIKYPCKHGVTKYCGVCEVYSK